MIAIHGMNPLPRLVDSALADRVRVMPAVVVTGARQTGKTVLVQDLTPGGRRYFTLDDLETLDAARREPEIKSPKLYWADTGVALHLAESDADGAHLENIVLHDLLAWRDAACSCTTVTCWNGSRRMCWLHPGGGYSEIDLIGSRKNPSHCPVYRNTPRLPCVPETVSRSRRRPT
jgi:predicted AAA+ superfamily ATPase